MSFSVVASSLSSVPAPFCTLSEKRSIIADMPVWLLSASRSTAVPMLSVTGAIASVSAP